MFPEPGNAERAVIIADSPMNLGVRFLVSYLQGLEGWQVYGLLVDNADSGRIEAPFSSEELAFLTQALLALDLRVLGISSIQRTRPRLAACVPRIRASLPSAIYIAGGIDAIAEPAYYFAQGIDLVCMGDGEEPLTHLLRTLAAGASRNQIVGSPPPGFMSMAKRRFSVPRAPLAMPQPYYGNRMQRLTLGGIIPADHASNSPHVQFVNRELAIDEFTQRGCTHACNFCAQDLLLIYAGDSPRNSTRRELAKVVEDIRRVAKSYGHKQFVYFWDLDFLRRPQSELRAFAKLYPERVGLPFFAFVTEKTVIAAGEEILATLVHAGLRTINMGLQSGNRTILHEVYGRRNTPEEALQAIEIIDRATVGRPSETIYDIITYHPAESPEAILDSIRLVCRIPPGDGTRRVRLSTHLFSQNTGQATYSATPTTSDYQDFVRRGQRETQSPYLSFANMP